MQVKLPKGLDGESTHGNGEPTEHWCDDFQV